MGSNGKNRWNGIWYGDIFVFFGGVYKFYPDGMWCFLKCSAEEPCRVPRTTVWRNHWPVRFVHDDVIKWKHFPRCWPFVRRIHRSPVNSPHKGQRRGALMFSLICVWINGWVNNREAGDLRRYRVHYDVTLMVAECVTYTKLHVCRCSAPNQLHVHK